MVSITTTQWDQPNLKGWRGSWQRLPEAPIEARSDAATGSAIDLADRSWFIVWGGYDADGQWLNDGTGYEFKHRRWTMLPPSPLPATAGDFDGTLNGYVAIAADPADGSPLTAWLTMEEADSREEANDFGTRLGLTWSWSLVFGPSLPTGERYEVVNEFGYVATLISYPAQGYASSVEQEFGTSDTGYRDEVTLSITRDGASGHRIERFAWIGNGTPPEADEPVTYGALSPLTRMGTEWRTTSPSPVTFDAASPLIVSPRHFIEPEQLVAWDPTMARWLRIRPPDGGRRTGTSAGWLQGHLLLWGGTTPDRVRPGRRLGLHTVARPTDGGAARAGHRARGRLQRVRVHPARRTVDRGDRRPAGDLVRRDPRPRGTHQVAPWLRRALPPAARGRGSERQGRGAGGRSSPYDALSRLAE